MTEPVKEAEPAKNSPASKCPICGKPTEPKYKPFCSARCADVDLNRWLSGVYKMPTNEAPDPSDPATLQPEQD